VWDGLVIGQLREKLLEGVCWLAGNNGIQDELISHLFFGVLICFNVFESSL
jgi:hypothetical protein